MYIEDLIINYINTNSLKELKQNLKMNKRQREIIIGTLLGDGHSETQNRGRTYRLKIEQSIKHKEYVDWLYQEFKDWVQTPPQIKKQIIGGKVIQKYWFNTLSHGSFRFYGQQFYQNKKKIVPKLINHWLTSLALAVWFMDDGSIKSKYHRARILNTQCFSRKEIERLINVLKDKFSIQCKLRKQEEGYQIMILAESAKQFAKIIKPFVHPTMFYKLKGLD